MANILLTQRCVRSCPYCFAAKHMSGSPPDDVLSWEDLIYLVDFLENSGEKRVSLLGGEPTLHPHFPDFVIYLLERNFTVTVFTSGIMAQQMLERASGELAGAPEDRLNFVCNLNDPQMVRSSFAERESLQNFLKLFGPRVSVSFNIYRPDFKLDFLFQLINRYHLQRQIRFGLAHPIVGRKNLHISPEGIEGVVQRLFSYAPLFERLKIRWGLDCGFPLCKFSDAQLGWMSRHCGENQNFGCGPAVDIGPDMTVWSCFPLSSFHKKSIFEFDCLADVLNLYHSLAKKVRTETAGIFPECDSCWHWETGRCNGGCLAHLLERFQHELRVRLCEVYG